MEEIWRPCHGYEGIIDISNLGRFRSLDRIVRAGKGYRKMTGIIRKPANDKDGYQLAHISIDGIERTEKLHRLVMKSFNWVENCEELEVNHKDGNKKNNFLDNLEWSTRKDNVTHAFETGLMPVKTKNKLSKNCLICNKSFHSYEKTSKYCSLGCHQVSRQVTARPNKEELFDLLVKNSFTRVGEMFGVTDNAIRRWCKSYNIPEKSKYYRSLNKLPTT